MSTNKKWGILIGLQKTTPNILLENDEEIIGRDQIDPNLRLVSSKHFSIKRIKNENKTTYVIKDSSSNGTYINDIYNGCDKESEIDIYSFDVIIVLKKSENNERLVSYLFLDTDTCKEINLTTKLFSNYTIENFLGCGCFGKVFKIHKKNDLNEKYAMKIIPIVKKGYKEKSIKEFEIMKQLPHQNIIHVYEIFTSENWCIILLELCEDGDLSSYLTRKKLTYDESKLIMKQLLEAIRYSHSNFIVHRDIKFENILIELDNQDKIKNIKLTDFGLSKIVGKDFLTNTICGTRQYISPEMYQNIYHRKEIMRNEKFSNEIKKKNREEEIKLQLKYNAMKSDIWACGVLLYEMMLNKRPFHTQEKHSPSKGNANPQTLNFKLLLKGDFIKSDDYNNLPPECKDLIENMICLDPKNRFSAEECLQHEFFIGRKHLI